MSTERSKRAIFSQWVVVKLRVWKIKGGYRETSGEEGDPEGTLELKGMSKQGLLDLR